MRDGLVLTLYTDDAEANNPDELRAEGRVHYDEAQQCWVAVVDWSALRHASEEDAPATNGPVPSDTTPESRPAREIR